MIAPRIMPAKYWKNIKNNIPKLIFQEENVGIAANWATCVKACRGKYICNCDNDDYWHNTEKLQLQFDYMEKNPGCNICATNYRIQNVSTGKTREIKAVIDKSLPLQKSIFSRMPSILNATIMYRADYLKANMPLDDFIKYRFTLQDWPALMILSAKTNIDIIPVSTATNCETVSVTRPNSVECLRSRLEKERECFEYCKKFMIEELLDEVNKNPNEWNEYVNERVFLLSYRLGDFKSANYYSKIIKGHSLKTKCAKTKLTFYLYVGLKSLTTKIL